MFEAHTVELSGKAKEKRVEVLGTLTEAEKEYSSDIKGLLEKTPDATIMHEDWSFDDVKSWARGKYYTPEKMEEIRKDSFKKGQEEAKILGLKEKDARGHSSGKTPVKKTTAASLTEEQKEQALNMFRIEGISDDKKYEMYFDHLKTKEKIDKNRRT